MQKIGKRKPANRLKDHMHMIRHDNEAIEEIAFAIEMLERLGNDLRHVAIAQEAGAVTLVKPALTVFDKSLVIFVGSPRVPWFRMMRQPFRQLLFPLGPQCRNSSATGRDEIRTLLAPNSGGSGVP